MELRIMVVERDKRIRASLREMLGKEKAPAFPSSHTRALRLLSSDRIDLCFADLSFYGTARDHLLRVADDPHRSFEWVLVVGADEEGRLGEDLPMGVDGFLGHPFKPLQVLSIVHRNRRRVALLKENRDFRGTLGRVLAADVRGGAGEVGRTKGAGDPKRSVAFLKEARRAFEKYFVQKCLEDSGYNQTLAARKLGVHRNTLILKMRQGGLAKPSHRGTPSKG